MVVQRCIWWCLYNSPGAESAEYDACVVNKCSSENPDPFSDPAPQASPAQDRGLLPGPTGGAQWSVTPTAQGGGTSIGATDPETGVSVHLLCMADGRRLMALFGLEGGAARLTALAGGRPHDLFFTPHAGGYYAEIPSGSALVSDLVQTTVLVVLSESGWVQAQLYTVPAHTAIRAACP